ncbi:hypothetical protein INT43_001984 [Umbelopsis isabellina]|uniref:RPA43 OB domain-containing protein n=1 Tax=Mortierella isabellina TaxID=91625 RepID=A0A8H7PTA6_MORIS|nr:hypothetical protein INT43_001984 [Umbelopsis isabellina]
MAPHTHTHKEAKKRKHADHEDHSASKKSRLTVEKSIAVPDMTAFSEVSVRLYLHLAPTWAGKTTEGINEQLNAFLMKYIPEVDGIVVAHSGLRFETANGRIMYDSPFSHFFIRVKLLVWKPNKGEKLVGKINLQSPDHIGLLIYGTFNASIPREHISQAHYEWRASTQEDQAEEESDEADEADQEQPYEYKKNEFGEWIDKESGQGVADNNGVIEFNVVNLVSANDILTVTGALLAPSAKDNTTSLALDDTSAPKLQEKSKKDKKEKKKSKKEKS